MCPFTNGPGFVQKTMLKFDLEKEKQQLREQVKNLLGKHFGACLGIHWPN